MLINKNLLSSMIKRNNMRIKNTKLDFIREKLTAPFGFKGNYLNELWQVVVELSTERYSAQCPSVQSVLWADSNVFASAAPAATNALMLAVTAKALSFLEEEEFSNPKEALEKILPQLGDYAAAICGQKTEPTFVLNSLVGVDLALWSLYARENGATSFDDIIPENAKSAMSARNAQLVKIPLISYNVGSDEIKSLLEAGASLLKIKIGAPTKGKMHEEDMRLMVEADKKRLCDIHSVAYTYNSPYTVSGKILYYLDANGRYDSKKRLNQLLDYAAEIGALENIAVLEEPFPLGDRTDVSDLPVVVAADESAHSLEDVKERLKLGYKAVALKPIAKTLTVSFDMAAAAFEAGATCFCADLTVNPLLTEWNKQFAARLLPLPGMRCGCVEVNGDMNYVNWNKMKEYLPKDYPYTEEKSGVFKTNNQFFECGARLFYENGYKSALL